MELIELVINNKSFGVFNGVKIFFTKKLHDSLSLEKTKKDKIPILDLFTQGRALQGLKHLVESIQSKNNSYRIIFTEQKTTRTGLDFFINYEEYRQKAQGRFYSLYRTTGLDIARSYLNSYFPEEFPYDNVEIPEKELKKVDKNFPELIKELSKKAKHKRAIVDQTTEVLKSLREEKTILSKDIESLKELQKQSSISYYQQRRDELISRLKKKYPETKGSNSWQTWIYSNSWIFGISYQTPIQKEKVGFDNIPDYLFPTLDNFIDILEIKKPDVEVLIKDNSHAGSYIWSSTVNQAIGQVVNYIHQIELNQLQIQQNLKRNYPELFKTGIFTIKPRALILVGTSEDWEEEKREAFRKLNYSLHGIEILTYTDLLQRAEKIISMYSDKNLK